MRRSILLLLALCWFCFSFSQNFGVSDFQKINEINGNFFGDLDNDDFFGISIDNIGDLDGNGVNDLAVGAYADDDGGFNSGAVWILFLDNSDKVISHTKISATSGGFVGNLDDDDRFGGAVSYLGDLNNDGLIELAVGADYDGDGGFWHGAVWILSLNQDGTVNAYSKISDTQGGFTGTIEDYAIFGTDIANIGDLNNDGIQDLAVGSRRAGGQSISKGAVWILFMNQDFTVNSYQKIGHNQGNFTILDNSDYFGGSVANIGDLNGDGVIDIAVGAYRDDDLNSNSGCFYILFLNSDGTVNNYQKVSNNAGGLDDEISFDALFGESIDGIVDIDNDGKVEIVVGALRQENPSLGTQTGAFYIIELNNNGTVSEEYLYTFGENCFSGQLSSGDFFGGAVTFLSESNTIKVAAGAYRDSENGSNRGAIWILSLGDINFNLESVIEPSCNASNGSITISGLISGFTYTVSFTHDGTNENLTLTANASGEITILGLSAGSYTNILVTENDSDCTSSIQDVVLNGEALNAVLLYEDPISCENQNGSFTFSGLNSGFNYTITYSFENATLSSLWIANTNGEIVITGLAAGTYTNILINEEASTCSNALQDVVLNSMTLDADLDFENPSSCNSGDGRMTISGLSEGLLYTISYTFEESIQNSAITANSNGEVIITGLTSGEYSNILILEEITGCTDSFGDVELTCIPAEVGCFKPKLYFTPNNDGVNDYWSLILESNECNYVVYIFDRYGKLLKMLTNQQDKWDGTFNGEIMPANDYWYRVDYLFAGENRTYISHFTLKR